MLQVNGKLRGKLVVPASADEGGDRSRRARRRRKSRGTATRRPVKKVVVVPGRLVNVVV